MFNIHTYIRHIVHDWTKCGHFFLIYVLVFLVRSMFRGITGSNYPARLTNTPKLFSGNNSRKWNTLTHVSQHAKMCVVLKWLNKLIKYLPELNLSLIKFRAQIMHIHTVCSNFHTLNLHKIYLEIMNSVDLAMSVCLNVRKLVAQFLRYRPEMFYMSFFSQEAV